MSARGPKVRHRAVTATRGWIGWLALVVGLAALGNAVYLLVMANFNAGLVMEVLVGLVLIGFGLVRGRLRGKLRRLVHVVLAAGLAVLLGMTAFLALYGVHDNVTYDEDAVIVLGAAVHGTEPTLTLRDRLDVALDYHAHAPGAVIVVTGGQGPQEDIPEGEAMRAYLVARGVPSGQILVEDQATSTAENFALSRALLEETYPGQDLKVAYVTQESHVYRAGLVARDAGLDATHAHAASTWYVWPSRFLRETCAVIKTWLAGP
jgi:uncharacterized SAM-binding protein YcdF (DUF218 family)